MRSAPGLSGYSFVLIIAIFAVGCLPKELGDLANLKHFDVSQNSIEGQLSIRTERLDVLLTISALRQENYPRSLAI